MSGPDDIPITYQRVAVEWDRARNRSLFEETWLTRAVAGLEPGARVLDLGCGAGEPVAGWLIAQGFAVTGVDIAPAMLEIAKDRFPAARWICADMRGLDLGERFDAVIAFDSFFHLSPQAQQDMFATFAQHLTSGGHLLFTCGPDVGEPIGSVAGVPVYHASLSPAHYAQLLEQNGLIARRFVAQDPECAGRSLWLAQRR
ncbi:methyltransferase [Thioclava dalianensis]|uniref:Methyltransferase n=1 Tax=Thioclava dalianensis TaxID=1185766 RepID=A0A074TCX8_9RHOB|nr:class I SAM-dependent methyltransferase [Thioclava dalianensis]KEP69559.1 methyltransferase [Thioclava dalianensis]SFN14475.1 Methyltransferase domain-containing protein [Thioclava dalianensis]